MCSDCGNIKENLKDNKIYECTNCGKIIGGDINGSRMIYIKSIIRLKNKNSSELSFFKDKEHINLCSLKLVLFF